MTKKDYELIASKIYLGKVTAQSDLLGDEQRIQDVSDTIKSVTIALCAALEAENARFNRKAFIKKATLGE